MRMKSGTVHEVHKAVHGVIPGAGDEEHQTISVAARSDPSNRAAGDEPDRPDVRDDRVVGRGLLVQPRQR